jgi:hypothetical protein
MDGLWCMESGTLAAAFRMAAAAAGLFVHKRS